MWSYIVIWVIDVVLSAYTLHVISAYTSIHCCVFPNFQRIGWGYCVNESNIEFVWIVVMSKFTYSGGYWVSIVNKNFEREIEWIILNINALLLYENSMNAPEIELNRRAQIKMVMIPLSQCTTTDGLHATVCYVPSTITN